MQKKYTLCFDEDTFEYRMQKLQEIIDKSKNIVFFGGAGVSTASGIPDFRSENGLYKNMPKEFQKYEPEYVLSKSFFHHNPKMFYEFYRNIMDLRNYEPNIVHKKLAELEKTNKNVEIITQNIDMLHEKAGSSKVYKIHGTIGKNHCIKCGKEFDINYIFDSKEKIPHCDSCNSSSHMNMIKPNVVLYDEMLPKEPFEKANKALLTPNCLIVCGTSLTVYPAAAMVQNTFAKDMVIINREPTPLDKYADVVFHEDMNEIFKLLKV